MSQTPQAAWPKGLDSALAMFEKHVLRKGRFYADAGRVLGTSPLAEGTGVHAMVMGGAMYASKIVLNDAGSWETSCTCSQRTRCKHTAALLLKSLDLIRQSQPKAAPPKVALPKPFPERLKTDSFLSRVRNELGRGLTSYESNYCHAVQRAFGMQGNRPTIDSWTLASLGLHFECDIYGQFEYGPTKPDDVMDFWHLLVLAARDQGKQIPDFLAGIAISEEVETRVAAWKRLKDLRRWMRHCEAVSESVEQELGLGSAPAGELVEFRLRITESAGLIEVKRAGQTAFTKAKVQFLNELSEGLASGSFVIQESSRPLVDTFQACFNFRPQASLNYADDVSIRFLSRILRLKPLPVCIVGEDEAPLQWIDEPLQWRLTPPEKAGGEYELQLCEPDGSLPPPAVCVIGVSRSLYLTSTSIRPAPPIPTTVLKPGELNRIPAQVIETPGGIRFLTALAAKLPPNLESRVQKIEARVSIRCKLVRPNAYSSTEYCDFAVSARASSAMLTFEAEWNGKEWLSSDTRSSGGGSSDEFLLGVVDRVLMDKIPSLMAVWNLKPAGYYGQNPKIRLTKQFPETFSRWIKTIPPEIKLDLDKELKSIVQGEVAGSVQLHVEEDGVDWFNLRVTIDTKSTDLTPEELKALLDARGNFVRLKGKGWRRMEFALTEEEDQRLAMLGLNPRELSSEPQRLHALQLAHEAARKFLPQAQVENIERRASEIRASVTPSQPATVEATLRPYQTEGFHFLAYLSANRFGGILADDMGLGKTLQALTWLAWLRHERQETGPSLVVCPKSVTENWKSESARFTPGLRVRLWIASDAPRLAEEAASADLHIVNYVQLRLSAEAAAQVQWVAVILDEGQNIKNPDSQTAQAARSLRAGHRLVLSGTPVENRLLDLWSLMAFAMPGALGNRTLFQRNYDAKGDPLARQRLAARVRPFLLRRTKTQVARDLPDRIEEDLFCEIEGEQKRLYQAELKLAQRRLLGIETKEQLAKERFHFLTSLLRLRQICCHTALVKPGATDESAKVNALVEMLEPLMEEGHKVLVFSQFVGMLEILEATLAEAGAKLFKLTGSTEDRGELVREFQSHEGAAIFLISLKAGGFGLNLTAASYVVLFDPWWNPAVENQAIDRTHRIGQTSKVIAYRLLIKNSIEEKIRLLQKQKSAVAEDLLGEEKFAQSLTMDDLQFLLA